MPLTNTCLLPACVHVLRHMVHGGHGWKTVATLNSRLTSQAWYYA